eukprot:750825-Prymnesium_polylepis.1
MRHAASAIRMLQLNFFAVSGTDSAATAFQVGGPTPPPQIANIRSHVPSSFEASYSYRYRNRGAKQNAPRPIANTK